MLEASLIVVGGEAADREIRLRLPAVIGRGREVDVVVSHSLVSRLHCELFEREGRLFVRDLQSLNGTYVNNFRIVEEEPLLPGQLLTLGNVTFRAQYELSPQPAAAAEESPARPAPGRTKAAPPATALPVGAGAGGQAEELSPADLIATISAPAGGSDLFSGLELLASPARSISVSALNDLPAIGPAASGVGDIVGANARSVREIDTDEIDLDIPGDRKAGAVRPEDSALKNFLRQPR